MKQLFENWRQHLKEELLMEISYKDALVVLDGARTKKILKSYRYIQRQAIIQKHEIAVTALKGYNATEREFKDREAQMTDALHWLDTLPDWQVDNLHADFAKLVRENVPTDLEDPEDNQKGAVIMWFIKMARSQPRVLSLFTLQRSGGSYEWEGRRKLEDVGNDLELFFRYNQFMEETDLMLISSFQKLGNIVEAARYDIEQYQKEQLNLKWEEGTEVLRDDKDWFIAILSNKAAACHFGSVDWCTADPGGTMFEHYYKPTDPLFYFEDRSDMGRPPVLGGKGLRFKYDRPHDADKTDKYQVHYGSKQFKDETDHQVSADEIDKLHNLLKQTGAAEKYPIIKEYDHILLFYELEGLISIDDTQATLFATSPEEVEKAAGGFLDSLEPAVAHKLAAWASAPMTTEGHVPGPGWVPKTLHAMHWLAGPRFWDNEEVGLNMAETLRMDTAMPRAARRAITRLALNHSSEKVRFKALDAMWRQLGVQWMKEHDAPDGETYYEKFQAAHFKFRPTTSAERERY